MIESINQMVSMERKMWVQHLLSYDDTIKSKDFLGKQTVNKIKIFGAKPNEKNQLNGALFGSFQEPSFLLLAFWGILAGGNMG